MLRVHSYRRQAGFTLLELMIVLAVVGLMMWAGMRGLSKVSKTNLREDAMELAGALRTAYNLATETGRHHRVVFDLDAQAYRVETCEGQLLLRKSDAEEVVDQEKIEEIEERVERAKRALENKNQMPTMGGNTSDMVPEIVGASSPEKAAEAAAALAGVQLGAARCGPPRLSDGKADERGEVHQIRTKLGLSIRQVHVSHLREPVKEGVVSINFFPLGVAEKAVIEIVDKDAEQYTLLVHRMTGRTEFREGEIKVDEFMNRDGAGDREDERGE